MTNFTRAMLSHHIGAMLGMMAALEKKPIWHRNRPRHEFNGKSGKLIHDLHDLAADNILQWFHHIVKDSAEFSPPLIETYQRLMLARGINLDEESARARLTEKTAPLRHRRVPPTDLIPEFYRILTRQKEIPPQPPRAAPEMIRVPRPSDIRLAARAKLGADEQEKIERRKITIRKPSLKTVDRSIPDPDYHYLDAAGVHKLACDVHLLLRMLCAPHCAGDDPSILRNSLPLRQALADIFRAQQIDGIPSTGLLLYAKRMKTRNLPDPFKPTGLN